MTSTPPPAPGAAPPRPSGDAFDRFTNNLRGSGVYRSDDRWIAGVCAGIAERLRVDPLIVRAGFVLLGLVFGAGITIYLVAWLLMPDRQGTVLLARAIRGGDGLAILLLIVASIVVMTGMGWAWGNGPAPVFSLLIVAGLVWFFTSQRDKAGASPQTSAVPGGPGTPGTPGPS